MGCGASSTAAYAAPNGEDRANATHTSSRELTPASSGAAAKDSAEKRSVYNFKRGRRASISAEVMSPSFFSSPASSRTDLAAVKSDAERRKLLLQLQSNYLFAETGDLEVVIDAMRRRNVEAGEVLMKQGDTGDNFYIVASGKLRVTDASGIERVLMQDECIGEIALLYSSSHDFTAVAEDQSELWALGRRDFLKAICKDVLQRSPPAEALQSLPMFESLTDEERNALADVMDTLTVPAAKELEREHEQGDKFYVLRKGKCTVTQMARTKPMRKLESASTNSRTIRGSYQSNFFGVNALMNRADNNVSSVTSTTAGKVSCFCVSRDAFRSIFTEGDLQAVMKRGLADQLRHVQIFSGLEEAELRGVAARLHPYFYKPGQVILRQGDLSVADPSVSNTNMVPALYVLGRGECKMSMKPDGKHGGSVEVMRLHKRAVFGLTAVYPSSKDQPCTIEASSDVLCWGLSYAQLLEFMKNSEVLTHAVKNEVGLAQTQLDKRISETIAAAEKDIQLQTLKELTILGVGSFGQVKLVCNEASGKTYALKCMQKKLIVNYGQKTHVMNEKAILSEIRHPFVNRLLRTFKDTHYLYMLLEVVLGGELFTVLKRKGRLPDDDARFYASNITLFFECMHKHHTVYRDLKPENMLLDKLGYIIVVDFGFAKKVYDKTYTLCGTTDYLAPEVIQHKGHNAAYDWWTLGIFIYELKTGKTPFQADSAQAAYQNILTGPLYFSSVFSENAKQLVKGLLHKNPSKRLGMSANGESSAARIKSHPWFTGFDWQQMLARELKSPWQPEWDSNTDTHNFDKYDERDLPPPPSDYVDKDPGWDADF